MKLTVTKTIYISLLIYVFCVTTNAQTYNNYQKEYVLTSLTDGQIEADRTHRMILCDYQPSGLYVKKGEKISLNVSKLSQGYNLSSMIGFKPMWGNRNKAQENELRNGINTIIASQDGILSFIFVKNEGYDTKPGTVKIKITGGKAFPLYQFDKTSVSSWQNDLKTMTDAPFVQLISDKVLITIPYQDYLKSSIGNMAEFFKNVHKVIDWEDELAGFDNSSPQNTKTNNRIHYLVDIYATAEESDLYYMYASNHLIGMKKDNFDYLTANLSKEWGIWHETGHTHQQNSWTWNSIREISVNIYSLYVQEQFDLPSRLNIIETGETETPFKKAKMYLSQPDKNYLVANEKDYNEVFSKLVMFHQLKSVYGWEAFKKLHQYFRKKPFVSDENETDEDKVNKFVYAMCLITKNDLTPFFKKWGLSVDKVTAGKINEFNFPLPSVDPSKVFQ